MPPPIHDLSTVYKADTIARSALGAMIVSVYFILILLSSDARRSRWLRERREQWYLAGISGNQILVGMLCPSVLGVAILTALYTLMVSSIYGYCALIEPNPYSLLELKWLMSPLIILVCAPFFSTLLTAIGFRRIKSELIFFALAIPWSSAVGFVDYYLYSLPLLEGIVSMDQGVLVMVGLTLRVIIIVMAWRYAVQRLNRPPEYL